MAPETKRRKLSNGAYETSSSPTQPQAVEKSTTTAAENVKPDARRSLFVRSLPASVTTEKLTEHFSQSFPLKHATVVLDPTTKISRGFGFVTFADAEDAQTAVAQLNNSVLDGRKIKVEVAESRNREVEEDITGKRKETKNLKAEELRAVRQKQFEENLPPKLIVRNLPWSVKTSDDLSKLFLSYGKVKYATVPKGKSGQQAGFGFVILRGKKNAEKALAGVNGKEIDGRTLAVDWAVDRETWEKLQQDSDVQNDAADTKANESDKIVTQTDDDLGDDSVVSDGNANGTAGAPVIDNELSEELEESDEEEAIMNGDVLDEDSGSEDETTTAKPDSNNTTIFIRNLPFTAEDESLRDHFNTNHGPVRYARVVFDQETERSRGTAFVCFFNESDAKECVKNAPKQEAFRMTNSKDADGKKGKVMTGHSLLQNDAADPSGKYTMDGRILQVARALDKREADKRAAESSIKRDHDKRRLFLLSEGTIPNGSQLYNLLGKAEIDIRESSARQRQKLIKSNANLGLSLTRLSIRNLPRTVTTKDLKALAREGVVGFAKDVKEGKRQRLSQEEASRGGEEDREAEKQRKEKGKGIVKQVKIVFESEKTGSKVGEGKGGRSRGYGFIEYYGHRNALMGLRWLNGHLVKTKAKSGEAPVVGERGKRLIVEFAIENAQVVQRRNERERRYKENGPRREKDDEQDDGTPGKKRKRNEKEDKRDHRNKKPRGNEKTQKKDQKDVKPLVNEEEKNKIAMRNRIISEKRQKRKMRRGKA